MTNSIIKLIKHLKKYGYKKTAKAWKRNFLILQTPELITNQRIQGTIGVIIGLIIMFIVFLRIKLYYALVAVLAGIFLQYVSLKQLLAQKQVMNDLKDQFVEVGK